MGDEQDRRINSVALYVAPGTSKITIEVRDESV